MYHVRFGLHLTAEQAGLNPRRHRRRRPSEITTAPGRNGCRKRSTQRDIRTPTYLKVLAKPSATT